jgi:hypothetical protein
MKIASMLSIALLAGLSVAIWTSQASAQPAGWAAAAKKCRAQSRNQYPRTENDSYKRNRAALYRSCLFSAGYRP